ncbi:MAG: hypothetical protein JSS67_02795 [Bacteroidetes bacterium]|nr:hypothetical protein [Bacteroidota bacterium]
MDKTGALIYLLQEQFEQGSKPETLIATIQMILAELNGTQKVQNNISNKASVRMPAHPYVSNRSMHSPLTDTEEIALNPEKAVKYDQEEDLQTSNIKLPEEIVQSLGIHSLDDIPTFAHQEKELFELNEKMRPDVFSLNERLKPTHEELAHKLKDTPIKDLRMAIGVNDRFLFINDLFRGDENMYERSLKTIDAFHSLPEAEYWIQRELKVKIGWPENHETVNMFDQLIKRRFSFK